MSPDIPECWSGNGMPIISKFPAPTRCPRLIPRSIGWHLLWGFSKTLDGRTSPTPELDSCATRQKSLFPYESICSRTGLTYPNMTGCWVSEIWFGTGYEGLPPQKSYHQFQNSHAKADSGVTPWLKSPSLGVENLKFLIGKKNSCLTLGQMGTLTHHCILFVCRFYSVPTFFELGLSQLFLNWGCMYCDIMKDKVVEGHHASKVTFGPAFLGHLGSVGFGPDFASHWWPPARGINKAGLE